MVDLICEILCLFSPMILVLVGTELLLNGDNLGGWLLIIYSFVVFGIYIRRYLLKR